VPAICTVWKWRYTEVWGSQSSEEVWCTNSEVHLKCWEQPQVKCHAVGTKLKCKINNFSFILVAVVYIMTVRCEQLLCSATFNEHAELIQLNYISL
jgi:hypothetical protein